MLVKLLIRDLFENHGLEVWAIAPGCALEVGFLKLGHGLSFLILEYSHTNGVTITARISARIPDGTQATRSRDQIAAPTIRADSGSLVGELVISSILAVISCPALKLDRLISGPMIAERVCYW
jgi:hypothetical protein